jgi:hypothetical protein
MPTIVDRRVPQGEVPQPVCRVYSGTHRDPMSDTINRLPCSACHSSGQSSWQPNVASTREEHRGE